MTTTKRAGYFAPHGLALAVALSISAPAAAVSFNIGEIEGQFDSALSVGASWSTAKPDHKLVGTTNFIGDKRGEGYTQTGDDYRLNFQRGKTFSKIFKGSHDLELKYGDFGAFVRGKYWYDFELKDESQNFRNVSDKNRKEAAKSAGAEFLDAFVYYNYSLGDLPGSVRVGRQVVSWGESTFIGNSINSINPLDAAAFRRPGAEVKEGLIPVNMVYVSQSLTDRLSMEAFYQLEWDQTIADNCGTFFATADVVADGCDNYYRILNNQSVAGLLPAAGALKAGYGITIVEEGLVVPRGQDRDARDSGQWGLALRWMGDETEYAAYAMNYHSRTPTVNFQYASSAQIGAGLGAGNAAQAVLLGSGNYFLDYPEDIRLYGLSFSTSLPTGTAWQGEISYRPNMPLQMNGTDLTVKLAADPAALAGAGQVARALALGGQDIKGYNRKEVVQVQTTFTHFFDQVMGAGRMTLVGEIGATRIGALENRTYGRDSIYGSPNCPATGCAAPGTAGYYKGNIQSFLENGNGGFYSSTSWGYRARAIWDYSNVFAGINLSPSISWSHDVNGYGPVFNEGAKAISFGVDANYRNTYSASLSYTNFFGGDYNVLEDRDFIALSFGVNF